MTKRNKIFGKNKNTKALKTIDSYQIESITPIYYKDRVYAIVIKIIANGYIPVYLSWEGPGGAVALWFKSPVQAYYDLMSAVWNATFERSEAGYECEPFGMFDQWIFPCDNCIDEDPDEWMGRTDAENRLYFQANVIYWAIKDTCEAE